MVKPYASISGLGAARLAAAGEQFERGLEVAWFGGRAHAGPGHGHLIAHVTDTLGSADGSNILDDP